jgi:hypothetical protein
VTLVGECIGGWHDHEARRQPTAPPGVARWTGEPLAGRLRLLIGEQEVGDSLQFLRFVNHPALRAAGRVVVSCQPALVTLIGY